MPTVTSGAKHRGKLAFCKFTPTSGSEVNLGAKGTQMSYSEQAQGTDVTTFDSTAKEELPDDPQITLSLTGLNVGGGAPGTKVATGTTGTLVWGWEGSASGDPSFSAPATARQRGRQGSVGGGPEWTLEFTVSAMPTTGTVT